LLDDRILLALDAIRRDSRSGAVELANRAALLLMEFCDGTYAAREQQASSLGHPVDDPPRAVGGVLRVLGGGGGQFESELASLCRALIGAQPGMAPLLNLCNDVVRAAESPGVVYLDGKPQPATPAQAASNAALRFYAFLAHHPRRIANEMLPYIHSGALLLTHSSSATVLAALLRAHDAGKRFGVVCTESRPLFEGVHMARHLADAGIGVEVIADAAAAVFIHGFYALLIGADAITPAGIINKVGTLGMALAARSAGVPVYCLAGSEKFLPVGGEAGIEERDPAEIVAAEKNLQGFNIYFDQTPLELITKFFSEDGVLTPAGVLKKLSAVSLHPSLLPDPK
jgi:translation initiation factor 2B subunit (eIF-2B alpha/beta/delta family)